MLTIVGDPSRERFCDGMSRRSFLRLGGLSVGGLSLADLLRAESTPASRPKTEAKRGRQKSIIMIFLPGGPPHQDMFDLKMDAPSEIRGEFKPIKTNVPGIEICELFPRMAAMMDRLAIIRSIVGARGSHYAFQCMTGRSGRAPEPQPQGGWPALGSVLSKLEGPAHPAMPPYVGLAPHDMGHRPWADPGRPGFLGPAHAPFLPSGAGRGDMVLNGVSADRLSDRKTLLASFDRFRRHADASGLMDGMDSFQQQAFGILTSSRLAEAMDLEREESRVRDRYGRGSAKKQADGAPKLLDHFLVARRLVEAGVRCVTLAFSRWDWHGGNFHRARQDFPMLDQGVTALVEDLQQRGLDRDVSVVVWGEFGRTPKINERAGRDHWPRVSCALMYGGGIRGGQVIGATDRWAAEATERPVHFQEVLATLYHNVGIDVNSTTVPDLSGRPQYLVDEARQPLPELV